MRPPHSRKTAAAPIVREWDFSECADDEIEFCCFYEYARESEATIKRVTSYRLKGAWETDLYPGDAEYYRTNWFLSFFRHLVEFPDKPWLVLKPQKRKRICAECREWEGSFISVDPERLNNGDDAPYPYFPTDTGSLSLHSVHAVEIDWTESLDAIKKAFAQWLQKNQPTSELIWEKRGRVSDRELLKYLGALRLLRAFHDWQKADEYAAAKGSGTKWTPSYIDHAGWIRARKKATEMIQNGFVFSPAAALIRKLDLSKLDSSVKARAKVLISQLERSEVRRLMQQKAGSALAELLTTVRLAHKK
jgi:hypothetical protein